MKRFLAVPLILFTALGTAQPLSSSESLQSFKAAYNNQTGPVPDFLGNIAGGERVNFKVATNSTNQTIGLAFEGVKISNISEEGFEHSTLKVFTDQETIKTVMNSENKYQAVQAELEEGDIKYNATTVGAGIKVSIVETLRGIADSMGLNF